jgi:hypothetical protein
MMHSLAFVAVFAVVGIVPLSSAKSECRASSVGPVDRPAVVTRRWRDIAVDFACFMTDLLRSLCCALLVVEADHPGLSKSNRVAPYLAARGDR